MTDTEKPTPDGHAREEDWADEEREAMKERARELKASRRKTGKADPEAELLARIAELPEPDRGLAERIHALVSASAPELAPKLWYGMPAWAKNGKVVCFFTPASKFKSRYASFGFNDPANLDDGTMWATSFGLTDISPADEKKIVALVKKSVS